MYTTEFKFIRPKSLAEAAAAFRSGADPRYIAGGQTLIPTMKLRLAAPTELIDLSGIPAMESILREGNMLAIGAGARHADVATSKAVRAAIPALSKLAGDIGDPAVRHRGTIGGSLANNDPAADYPAGALALRAKIATAERVIPADEYFTGMFMTALRNGEIIISVNFEVPQRAGYVKFKHPASRFALVGVFAAQFKDEVRVAVTGAGQSVFRVREMEQALARKFAPDAIADIAVSPDGLNSDLHGSAEYRAHLVTVIAKRAVAAAIG